MNVFAILFAAVFSGNVIFSRFFGICPFLGVSKKTSTALGMGVAVTFVMSISSLFTFALYRWVLLPLELEYIKTLVFILTIASVVQVVDIILKRFVPGLHSSFGVYLPLITTNCAVLGLALISATPESSLLYAFLNGMFSGLGFALAIVLLSGIREKLEILDMPPAFKGFPITLLAAFIMALAFSAFRGIVF